MKFCRRLHKIVDLLPRKIQYRCSFFFYWWGEGGGFRESSIWADNEEAQFGNLVLFNYFIMVHTLENSTQYIVFG